jgi:uroporphyrinogen III methyltransferase/synthase
MMPNDDTKTTGKVYLVGAGPGDAGLITLRGIECLHRADVVMFDYLVNSVIVEHAPETAERICLGKHGRSRIWPQIEINRRLVELAKSGRQVVRLKGGDPAVFARGAEEIDELRKNGIEFEVVPGITAALAAGSYAGIPITHRKLASAVALVTGREENDKETAAIDYGALAAFPGTLVIYMGVTTAVTWTSALISAGRSADTPTAIVRRCSLPDQLIIQCTLGEVAEKMSGENRIRPPAIVIVGDVTTLAPTLSWFDKRPLFGQTIMVTRARAQASSLASSLAELGAMVVVQPAIEITAPVDWQPVDAAIERLDEYDWLVFSSTNGVRFFLERLFELGRDVRALGGVRLAAVGPGTSDELARYHLRADLQPETFHADGLIVALANETRGKRFLLPRASRGREILPDSLREAGGIADQIVVYSSQDVQTPEDDAATRLVEGNIDWITVTSSAIARSLVRMFGDDLRHSRLASLSPLTSNTLRELGFEPTIEAKIHSMDGLVESLLRAE